MLRNLLCKEKINFSFLICITCSILLQSCYTNPTEKLFEEQKLINLVRCRAAKQIQQDYNLIPIGTGAEALYKIKMLALAFICDDEIDIEHGRELLIKSSKIFLDKINMEERLHPYLVENPFPIKNIEIAIYIKKQKNVEKSNRLVIVSVRNNKLYYEIRDPNTDRLTTIFTETYEEAVKKVRL